MFASTPVELSFIVTTSLEQPPTMPSAFSEKLKYAICSSVLLAEPSASLLHDAPSSMRRGRDGTEIKTLLAIVAALVAFQIAWWPLLPVALAIAWALHWRETREGAVTKPQRRLLDRLEDLLASAQHFDSILHRSTTLVREVECVSRGLGLCVLRFGFCATL